MSTETFPRIGVALIIKQNGRVLLGRRHNDPMPGSWQLPGGWLHTGESPEQAVQRQLKGFPGLLAGVSQFVTYTNNVFDQQTHTVSLYFMITCMTKDQYKPGKHADLLDCFWADWTDLPQPLFLPLQLLKQSGFNPA